MFLLNKWPTKRRKPIFTKRRSRQPEIIKPRPRVQTHLEILYDQGIVTRHEFETAEWFICCWRRNLMAIDAPRLKTTTFDRTDIKGLNWSDELLLRFESDWNHAKGYLNKQSPLIRSVVEETLLKETECSDVTKLKKFLNELDLYMHEIRY